MKKILLIIAIAFCIFQMVVLAIDIDIGSAAINRAGATPGGLYTFVDKNNPANVSGKITSVEIWANVDLALCYVATFYVVSGDNLSTRSTHNIGDVTAGAKRTFEVNLTVQDGDYIGVQFFTGKLERDEVGVGYWAISGDFIPCINQPFDFYATRTISVYGIGYGVPDQVTNVQATDGEHTDKVVITWNVASGATGYDIWTGSGWVDVGNVLTYNHTGAPAPTITHGSVTASDGTSTAHIALSNTGASANNGSSINYKVRAYNDVGDGAESATNAGYRGHGTLTYQWYRSNVDGDSGYGSIGGATASTYNDTAAPAPTITVGTASASDGTSSEHVTLSIAGESANIGAGRYYKCYHTATGATPGYTGVDRGYRTVGNLTYQWHRSSGDEDGDYSSIDGANTDPYNDTGAPANGNGRYYKCVENATGASEVTTNADRGYRLTVEAITWNNMTIIKWNNITVGDINTQ